MSWFSRILGVVVILGCGAPAAAQRLPFERTFDTTGPVTVDASTNRGTIHVSTGPAGQVVVRGTVTVRFSIDAPADAVERARRLAANPPVGREGERVPLRPPSDADDRRAVTVAYEVIVPQDTHVIATSDSGSLSIAGIGALVTARTQSGALAFSALDGPADITTGSGSVEIDGAGGSLTIATSSSAISARGVRSDLRVNTGSGSVLAESTGSGDIDITTQSSAITVTGAAHGVRATSHSGKIRVGGRPGAAWILSSSSGAIDVTLAADVHAMLDATTRSGSIRVSDLQLAGTRGKHRVLGTIRAGGPTVTIAAGSGSVDIRGR